MVGSQRHISITDYQRPESNLSKSSQPVSSKRHISINDYYRPESILSKSSQPVSSRSKLASAIIMLVIILAITNVGSNPSVGRLTVASSIGAAIVICIHRLNFPAGRLARRVTFRRKIEQRRVTFADDIVLPS
jgi:hypothetical protein